MKKELLEKIIYRQSLEINSLIKEKNRYKRIILATQYSIKAMVRGL